MIKNAENMENEVSEVTAEETEKKQPKKKESKANKEIAELKDLVEAKANELSEQNDKYLRLLAEYDNFKKRSAKEREAIQGDAVGDTVTKLLPVLDNFERAFASFSAEDKQTEFFKGIEMIYNQTVEIFTSLGVKEINALGEEFDPELHNAVMHIEDDTVADNIVIEEFQKGYTYGDKVIRYSMVKVAN